jgi:hypothetical protein
MALMPFAAVATSLETGAEIWLRTGSTLNAVRASLAMPRLFRPVRTGRRLERRNRRPQLARQRRGCGSLEPTRQAIREGERATRAVLDNLEVLGVATVQ